MEFLCKPFMIYQPVSTSMGVDEHWTCGALDVKAGKSCMVFGSSNWVIVICSDIFNFEGSFHLANLHLQFNVIVYTFYAFPFSLSSRDLVLTYWLPELDMLKKPRKGKIIFLKRVMPKYFVQVLPLKQLTLLVKGDWIFIFYRISELFFSWPF